MISTNQLNTAQTNILVSLCVVHHGTIYVISLLGNKLPKDGGNLCVLWKYQIWIMNFQQNWRLPVEFAEILLYSEFKFRNKLNEPWIKRSKKLFWTTYNDQNECSFWAFISLMGWFRIRAPKSSIQTQSRIL